ncbi:substrate-binding periplasmic protein [Hyphomicrobium sp.]|uniref:substrate-binding periplasmic protein n=1 Tax=Hyphomicrobium sp. TaxID=82 RepID=UPI002E35004F|nr:transporter substrate-binding domain-containing protein [Hyphomicrobium sp.]HEX2840058.1 transporter substrate-binding domain-containing protein [Hyphomicrobium sp.]
MRALLTVVIVVILWSASGSRLSARPLDEVVAAGSLRVIAYLDNAPFSFEKDGEPAGIDVEIAHAIAKELGVKAEVVLRMQGEKADDDVRANVWRGPLTGGGVGDIMMNVPMDREFALRNPEAVFGNPYFQERVVLAVDPGVADAITSFDDFKTRKVGVQLATVADYFLMTYKDGVLMENISHHLKPAEGIREFLDKDVSALLGIRSEIESLLHEAKGRAKFLDPDMPGIVRKNWVIGMAWKENSRDLGYAIEAALTKLSESGQLARCFEKYGVSYASPPLN